MTDRDKMISFMKAYSFATIVTVEDNMPAATHLPFVITESETGLILSAHFAKANSQWKQLTNKNQVLVIFAEPHAYISPRHYDSELNVPTWNYMSVHTYGKAEIVSDERGGIDELEKLINRYEPEYLDQWKNLPADMKLKLLQAIVPFRITVEDVQAKEKLSQNKNESERQRIIDSLQKSEHSTERDIAEYMQQIQ